VTLLLYMRDVIHSYVCHASLTYWVWHHLFLCVTWILNMRDASHSYVCHDSLICCGFIDYRNFGRHPWHDSFIYATWFMRMCDMTRYYVCHDSLICCGIIDCRNFGRHPWDMTHSYMRHDSSVCVWHDSLLRLPWLIHTCARTHLYVADS